MAEHPTGRLLFELKLFDDYGRVHGVVRREISEKAAYMGPRIKEDLELGAIAADMGTTPFDATVEVLRVREFRRGLLRDAAAWAGLQLADFLQDREGWHGLDRQEATEKIAKDTL